MTDDKKRNMEITMAIRIEYRKSSQKLSNLTKELEKVNTKLRNAENFTQEISYKQYKTLKEEEKELTEAVHNEIIARSVWDKAREVCLSIVDDEN